MWNYFQADTFLGTMDKFDLELIDLDPRYPANVSPWNSDIILRRRYLSKHYGILRDWSDYECWTRPG